MIEVAERQFLIELRSLLLKAVDLIERRALLGKYKTNMVEVGRRDSIAAALAPQVETVTETAQVVEQP